MSRIDPPRRIVPAPRRPRTSCSIASGARDAIAPYHAALLQALDGRVVELARERTFGLATNSADIVVSHFTLCCVRDVEEALADVQRVLSRGGTFVFFEHIPAPRGTLARALERVRAALFPGGCDRERDLIAALVAADFASLELNQVSRTLIAGVATKRGR